MVRLRDVAGPTPEERVLPDIAARQLISVYVLNAESARLVAKI